VLSCFGAVLPQREKRAESVRIQGLRLRFESWRERRGWKASEKKFKCRIVVNFTG